LPPADSTTGRLFTKALPRPELSISESRRHQGPLRPSCSWQPDQFHPVRRVRPSQRAVLQSITLVPLRQPLDLHNFFAFAKPAVRRTPSSYWGLLHPSRGGFPNFSLRAPPPPFRRQPYKVHHLHPVVNPGSRSLRPGFVEGRQVYAVLRNRSRGLFPLCHMSGTNRHHLDCLRAEDAGVGGGRGGVRIGGGGRRGTRAGGVLVLTDVGGGRLARAELQALAEGCARGSRSGRGDPAGAVHGGGGIGRGCAAPRRLAAPAEETGGTTAVPLARPAPERSRRTARPCPALSLFYAP
jgi:hypothetical protein